jgi:hypothetical protein
MDQEHATATLVEPPLVEPVYTIHSIIKFFGNYPGRLRAPMTSAFTACLGKG